MKNVKLHLLVLILVVIAEFIGVKNIPIGIGTIVLLPMLYAMIFGLLTTPKFLNIAKEKEMEDAGSLIGLTLMLLMAKYGTNIGPTLPKIIAASPALILQEFGNLGTVLLGIPIAVLLGLKREAIGGAHSIAREPNVALIGDMYGLDSKEGQGVLGVYIVGTVFGTIFIGLLASFLAANTPLHPYALAMASGVGSGSMMTAGVGSLVAMFPEMEEMLTAFGATSNMLSGLDGLYMSLWLALPLSEWLYKRVYKLKYGQLPEAPVTKEGN
ncbi:conserved membrane hypothetical protein [[Clostridium] ultunense Esp]|uniref:DUF3100 domain-containing protein n=1 Tax=[Clostridium] ultunense Esp TaxID=1288971 RepID=M1Z563_9FIRM|nr:DUF3100 domain-containing protein [Schnuerera ultunensis]CCQ93156.1 conserved membrane hypothetical protein [[Clostridium] ultunense Esp]SHD76422.1 conserved membrane protein of unknown function [[Clostridium] ultunense Esp]